MRSARGSTRFLSTFLLGLPILAGLADNAAAMEAADLQRRLAVRLESDPGRTCLAAAVVEAARVTEAYVCGGARKSAAIDAHTAFEIGSISKTITAALLADLIRQGKASLDAPLATYLPPGTPMPTFQGQPVLLRHVVTHYSGLPAQASRMAPSDPSNPYATLDVERLLGSLEDVRLKEPPGTSFEYSTFGYMLLSYIVAQLAGQDFEKQARQVLFEPLGMRGAYIAKPPDGVRKAMGHVEGRPVREWTFPVNFAGTGGVRATLPDMVRYLQAQMGRIDAPVSPALLLTQQPLAGEPEIGMGWFLTRHGNRTLHSHDGGTGGFTSVMMFDRAGKRGAVILADNNWTPQERMNALALHLLDLGPMPRRSKAFTPPPLETGRRKIAMQ
jgi:CubicO group peptidase (beta-lactamase class C family)